MRKVYCLGLDKTGTSTLHDTAAAHGVKALHHRTWAKTKAQVENELGSLAAYVKQYGTPPPEGHPGYPAFKRWRDFDFFCDGHLVLYEVFEQLFPDSHYIFQTRSLYNWIVSRYNHRVRRRKEAAAKHSKILKDMPEPNMEVLQTWLMEREQHCRKILDHFGSSERLIIINLEADDESAVCTALQTATGHPIKRLHSANIRQTSSDYDPHPAIIEQALKQYNIPPSEWHRTML